MYDLSLRVTWVLMRPQAFCAELSLKHGKSMDISDLADAVIAEDDGEM